jgi:hypothetical protein
MQHTNQHYQPLPSFQSQPAISETLGQYQYVLPSASGYEFAGYELADAKHNTTPDKPVLCGSQLLISTASQQTMN